MLGFFSNAKNEINRITTKSPKPDTRMLAEWPAVGTIVTDLTINNIWLMEQEKFGGTIQTICEILKDWLF